MNDVLNAYGYTVAAWRNRLPVEVWLLLIAVGAGCNFLIGFGAEKLSSATHAILPITASLAILLIADVEGPSNGFVRVHPGQPHRRRGVDERAPGFAMTRAFRTVAAS